jgi:hypothetical protein
VGFIIQPHGEFGPTLDKPIGQLNELYEIERYPLDRETGEPLKPENLPQNVPTPEQILRKASDDQAKEAAAKREKAPSLQANTKSPEQVLQEDAQRKRDAAKAATKRRNAKPVADPTPGEDGTVTDE